MRGSPPFGGNLSPGPLRDEFPGRRGFAFVIPVASDPTMDSARAGAHCVRQEGDGMPEHRIGTREEWQAGRDELARLEAEQAERNEEIKTKRLDLPWVPGEKEDEFDTPDGPKTPPDPFAGRPPRPAQQPHFRPRLQRR